MSTRTGTITVAQESRIRLVSSDGRSHLFLVAPGSGVEPQDLPALARDQTRVRVDYETTDGLIAGVVHSLEPVQDGGVAHEVDAAQDR